MKTFLKFCATGAIIGILLPLWIMYTVPIAIFILAILGISITIHIIKNKFGIVLIGLLTSASIGYGQGMSLKSCQVAAYSKGVVVSSYEFRCHKNTQEVIVLYPSIGTKYEISVLASDVDITVDSVTFSLNGKVKSITLTGNGRPVKLKVTPLKRKPYVHITFSYIGKEGGK